MLRICLRWARRWCDQANPAPTVPYPVTASRVYLALMVMSVVTVWGAPVVGVKVVVSRTLRDRCASARRAALVKGHDITTVAAPLTLRVVPHTATGIDPVLRAAWVMRPAPVTCTRERRERCVV